MRTAPLNILFLYNATQTYTDTVYQHINALGRDSRHSSFFCHHDQSTDLHVDFERFDVVAIHYSVRLPFDQFSSSGIQALSKFRGLKVLFIQDEYDHTHRAWHWMKALGVGLVFTVVPEPNIACVYPPQEFPGVRFVSVLTGYVPENTTVATSLQPPSMREKFIGYRGRPLALRYGKLGFEKVAIGEITKTWCKARDIACDIAWSEEARIYGERWFEFLASCKATLGSESGCNVFDWDGQLANKIDSYRDAHSDADDNETYRAVVAPLEIDGLMNQISPRVFEAIAMRTALVLFEGVYSGVLEPGRHYLPLKKDGSNLDEVIAQLRNGELVDALTERAWHDIIGSGRYSYSAFVAQVDEIIEAHSVPPRAGATLEVALRSATSITTSPIRANPPGRQQHPCGLRMAYKVWHRLPDRARCALKTTLKRL
jgi:hypothetical protein